MLFMFRMSIEILPLTVFSPELWIALILVVIVAMFRRRRGPAEGAHGSLVLLALIPVPLIMLAWGLYFWPSSLAVRTSHETIALAILNVFAFAEVVVAAWLVWLQRNRLPLAVGLACLALFWTAAARFVSSMAITNTWL